MALVRKLHILGSYWGYVLMSLHLGLHWGMMLGPDLVYRPLSAVPVIPVLVAAVVSVAACLAATAIPLRAVGSKSIVDAIETAE